MKYLRLAVCATTGWNCMLNGHPLKAVNPMKMRLDPWLDQKNDFLTVEVSS